jgi:hypothetical protein
MNEVLLASLVGLATTSSAVAGSAIGLYCPLSKRSLACILAFAAGALISALTIDPSYEGAAQTACHDTGTTHVGILSPPFAMNHEISGTIQRIDRKTVTNLLTGSSKPVGFACNSKETQFIHNGTRAGVDSLPIGASVQIRCCHPIVGSISPLCRVTRHASTAGNKTNSH